MVKVEGFVGLGFRGRASVFTCMDPAVPTFLGSWPLCFIGSYIGKSLAPT